MSRVIIYLKCNGESYINLEADEFHKDGEFIVACRRSETVAMIRPEEIRAIWTSEREKK